MTPEQARRLKMLVWRERLITWGPRVLAVLLAFAAYGLLQYRQREERVDPVVESHDVQGEIVQATHIAARGGIYTLKVRLSDGRVVQTATNGFLIPHRGEHAVLKEYKHKSGRSTVSLTHLDN
jgi:hypothetical protein